MNVVPSLDHLFFLIIAVLNVCDCKLQGRIINGYAADIKYFGFMASLQVDGSHICGGAIVSQNVVISAAHCDIYPADFYKLRVGSTNYDNGGKLVNVSRAIKHPQYDRRSADYDISLLILAQPLAFNPDESIAPLSLPQSDYVIPSGLGVTVSGWGTTDRSNNSATSTVLQSAALRTISRTDCEPMLPPEAITERMFCAQNFYQGQDACTGDSGGPLVYRGVLMGIISWGISCADRTAPGVYTNVPRVMDFINNHLA